MLISLTVLASFLEFDYDFEKFFPQEDDDLAFYHDYREAFENDNDFILVSIKTNGPIFDSLFLSQVNSFAESLRSLPHLREVINPIEQNYFEWGTSIVPMQRPYFHVNNQELYKEDSLRIVNGVEPIKEMVNFQSKSLIIVVKNIQLISKDKSDELASALEELIQEHPFSSVYTMGKIVGQKAYIDIMKREFITFAIVSILVLILFLIIAYKSVWGVLIPLLTVLFSVIGSLGIMKINGTSLNMMTTLLPVIMLVVGMSDVVHLVSKYLEEIRLRRPKVLALRNTIKKVGVATFLTSLTTALGFATLVGVIMKPIQDFGIYTAIGVLLAFFISILFIPSIFMLIKTPKIVHSENIKNKWDNFLGRFFLVLCRNQIKIIGVYVVITIVTLIGASKIKFDYFLMQDLDEGQPLMQELRFFQKQFGGIRPFEMAIMPIEGKNILDFDVIKEIEKIESYLTIEYELNQMASPALPFKFLNKAMRGNKVEYFNVPDKEKRFDYLKKQLNILKENSEWKNLISEEKNMGRIFGRMIDPGSREMLIRNEKFKDFFESKIDNSVISYKLTGTPVIIDESGRYVSKNIILGLLVAFGLIALTMGFLFRSIKMALISLIPNIFPILLTAGFIGFANIDLNMTTAIVFTIAFGIAVDDTIHFLSRYKQEMVKGRTRLYAIRRTFISTGKAIIITTLILLGGFGSLLFSDFLSTFYIGLFVCMTLLFAVITDLTLLPMILLGRKKNRLSSAV